MKAEATHSPGSPVVVTFADLPRPVPTGRQVLIRVGAVAVTPVDNYLRRELANRVLPQPFITGFDLAGTVVANGPESTRFKPGERVWCCNQPLLDNKGTFADYAVVEEPWLYPTPGNVPDEQAAALALMGITVHLGLFQVAHLRAGEVLFVNGGMGCLGSAVVQMAKAAGASVITTAGSDEKATLCREKGADCAINFRTCNVDEEIRKFAPGGVDLWYETQLMPEFERAIRLLAPRGRMVVLVGAEAKPAFPVGPFYVKGCSLHGYLPFIFSAAEQRLCAEQMNRWMAEGRLTARIEGVLPFSEAAQAHRLQDASNLGKPGTLVGKFVWKP